MLASGGGFASVGFPLIEVAGNAYQMGYQHGAQAVGLITRHIRWIESLTGVPLHRLVRGALSLAPAIEAFSPLLMEELHGLAAGAGISFGEALLCQLRGDAACAAPAGCTLFGLTGAATADGNTLAGQNLDLEPEYANLAILLRLAPNDGRPRALMFTYAGQLGYAGMNEHGLAHFNASLYDYRWEPGVPRQLVKRALLEKSSVDECIIWLRQQRATSAAGLLLCDGCGGLASVELRPEGLVPLAGQRPGCYLHTNHYLASEFLPFETDRLADSRSRLVRIGELIERRWGRVTVDTLRTILADHEGSPAGICRHGATGWHSIAGYIAEPESRLLHVRRGHGCTGTWHTYAV